MWHYYGHHYWWILWVIFIFWIFATPYDVPGQRKKKDSPLDILKKRFAAEEYAEKKKII